MHDKYLLSQEKYKEVNENYNRDIAKPENILGRIEEKLNTWDESQIKEVEQKLQLLLSKVSDIKVKKQTERLLKQQVEQRLCKICEETEYNVVFIPCAHNCVCLVCCIYFSWVMCIGV